MGFYCTAFCTCLFFAMAAAGAAKDDYPLIYEINTRAWLYSLSQSEGRTVALADVPDHELDRIAGLGAGVVWLMGVWSLGPYGLHHDRTDPGLLSDYKRELPSFTMADVIGSPYAITNYTVNPSIGTDAVHAAVARTCRPTSPALAPDPRRDAAAPRKARHEAHAGLCAQPHGGRCALGRVGAEILHTVRRRLAMRPARQLQHPLWRRLLQQGVDGHHPAELLELAHSVGHDA